MRAGRFLPSRAAGGPGGGGLPSGSGYGRESIPGGALAWTNWIAGIVAVYSTLFGLGKLVFGQLGMGLGLLAVAAVAFAWIARSFRSDRMADRGRPGRDDGGSGRLTDSEARGLTGCPASSKLLVARFFRGYISDRTWHRAYSLPAAP